MLVPGQVTETEDKNFINLEGMDTKHCKVHLYLPKANLLKNPTNFNEIEMPHMELQPQDPILCSCGTPLYKSTKTATAVSCRARRAARGLFGSKERPVPLPHVL